VPSDYHLDQPRPFIQLNDIVTGMSGSGSTTDDPGAVKLSRSKKERILDAAVEEFGRHGYSGARTAAIASRAGVNAQLISYYFGGKEGLLEALRERWSAIESSLVPADATFAEAVSAYAEATLDNASWARLVAWQALGDGPSSAGDQGQARADRLRESLERTRDRQREGELRDDVDPELIVLLGHLLAFAPIFMPQMIETIFGGGESWGRYREFLAEQLPILVERPPAPGGKRGARR
jgi:TetR/AcrR family transcriptional regulator